MLRFQPDSWAEGLLRPLLLVDPVAGIYLEVEAPDWRFAAFTIFAAVVLWSRKCRTHLNAGQITAALGLLLLFYVWTFVSGNGRYFVWGLVLIGPMLAIANRLLPCTTAMRLSLLFMLVFIQIFVLQTAYTGNSWGLVRVEQNPVHLDESPLRHEPAVFLTVSVLSYSVLVPRFHPQSRWANIAGQNPIRPGRPEFERLRSLLSSPLEKFLVLPLDARHIGPSGHPAGSMANFVTNTLAPLGLSLAPHACSFLSSPLSRVTKDWPADGSPPAPGFWICALQKGIVVEHVGREPTSEAALVSDVFDQIEQRCPRYFPPNGGHLIFTDTMIGRFYASSDVRVYIEREQWVLFSYFRALNPTVLGTVEQVRRGEFSIPCDKLPGRYRLPWLRD